MAWFKEANHSYTEELYKKDLHDPDNHDGVITHLELATLECKVKWAFGSITKNKANGGDEISVELFQILKDDAVKVLHSICQQIWKTEVATDKEKVSFHSSLKDPWLGEAAPQPEGNSVCARQAPARLGFPGALPQRRVVWMLSV